MCVCFLYLEQQKLETVLVCGAFVDHITRATLGGLHEQKHIIMFYEEKRHVSHQNKTSLLFNTFTPRTR